MLMQAHAMSAAVEGLQLRRCAMLLAYSNSRHPAISPGQTRQALLQVTSPCVYWLFVSTQCSCPIVQGLQVSALVSNYCQLSTGASISICHQILTHV